MLCTIDYRAMFRGNPMPLYRQKEGGVVEEDPADAIRKKWGMRNELYAVMILIQDPPDPRIPGDRGDLQPRPFDAQLVTTNKQAAVDFYNQVVAKEEFDREDFQRAGEQWVPTWFSLNKVNDGEILFDGLGNSEVLMTTVRRREVEPDGAGDLDEMARNEQLMDRGLLARVADPVSLGVIRGDVW